METMQKTEILISGRDVQIMMGIKRPTIYKRMRQGLLTSPIKNGAYRNAWPKSEISAIVAARIAGHDDDTLRTLVIQLMDRRKIKM